MINKHLDNFKHCFISILIPIDNPVRWCRKKRDEKREQTDPELNNAITE